MNRSYEDWAKSTDPSSLPSVSFDKREGIGRVCGVYFFISGTSNTSEVSHACQSLPGCCVLYVGKSEADMLARWRHGSQTPGVLLSQKRIDIQRQVRISWLEEDARNIAPLETAFIRRFDPPLNDPSPNVHLGRLLNRILGLDEDDGLINIDYSVDELTARIRENADRRGEKVRECSEAPDGTRDSPFGLTARSEGRNNAFRVTYALSIGGDPDEEIKQRFPAVVSLRDSISRLGFEVGSGYEGETEVKAIASAIGLKNVSWQVHAFAESSTRFAIVRQDNGKLKLHTEGSVWKRN